MGSNKTDDRSVGSIEDKLEKANAIRELLHGKIIKKKGGSFDDIEQLLRQFLQRELDAIFVPKQREESFSSDEIHILKLYAQRIKEKL